MGFGSFWLQLMAALIWIPLQLAVLLVYPSFLLWCWLRTVLGRMADVIFILIFVAYNVAAHTTTVYSIVTFDLPPVSSLFLSVEQLRWTMKSYSFIRENSYKVLYPWNKDDEEGPAVWYKGQIDPHIGSFSAYLYFLFCPTLLYRDNYPRSRRQVLHHLGGIIVIALAVPTCT